MMAYPPPDSGYPGYPGYPPAPGSYPPQQPSAWVPGGSTYPSQSTMPTPGVGGGGAPVLGFGSIPSIPTPSYPSAPHDTSTYPPFPSSQPPSSTHPPQPSVSYPPEPQYPPGPSSYPPPSSQPFPSTSPYGGYPQQQPPGGYPQQQPPGGYPQQPFPGGYPQQEPPGSYPQQQPPGGYPQQHPPGGYPQQQPPGGYPQQQPPGGYPQQPPPGGYPQQPPPVDHPPGVHPSAPPPIPSSHTHQTPPTRQMTDMSLTDTSSHHQTSTAAAKQKVPTRGTVKPRSPFDPEEDAKTLRTAMKGFGTDEKAIISVLAYRSNSQRQKIKLKFKTIYGRDLIADLNSELSGNFRDVVLGLMMTPAEYDASEVYKAIKGLGTDESTLIEILCTRTNEEISLLRTQYKSGHGRDIEKDVASDTSGHFKRLLISLLTGARDDDDLTVDHQRARADAQALYQAGEAKWGTNESKFNEVLASRSFPHLRVVFQEYSKICKYDIEQSISREMSGDLKTSMLTVVKCVRNKSAYFAERLYKSMKGLGTDDHTLVRVMVTRCEVDMEDIKERFYSNYHKTLGSFIKGDTSGDYRRILMALARADD